MELFRQRQHGCARNGSPFRRLDLGIAVSAFDALVGAHSYGRNELFVGLYFGGYGVNAPFGFVDFFWSKFAA